MNTTTLIKKFNKVSIQKIALYILADALLCQLMYEGCYDDWLVAAMIILTIIFGVRIGNTWSNMIRDTKGKEDEP